MTRQDLEDENARLRAAVADLVKSVDVFEAVTDRSIALMDELITDFCDEPQSQKRIAGRVGEFIEHCRIILETHGAASRGLYH